jgi:hypothetical protein
MSKWCNLGNFRCSVFSFCVEGIPLVAAIYKGHPSLKGSDWVQPAMVRWWCLMDSLQSACCIGHRHESAMIWVLHWPWIRKLLTFGYASWVLANIMTECSQCLLQIQQKLSSRPISLYNCLPKLFEQITVHLSTHTIWSWWSQCGCQSPPFKMMVMVWYFVRHSKVYDHTDSCCAGFGFSRLTLWLPSWCYCGVLIAISERWLQSWPHSFLSCLSWFGLFGWTWHNGQTFNFATVESSLNLIDM